jgi:hypothetical protein
VLVAFPDRDRRLAFHDEEIEIPAHQDIDRFEKGPTMRVSTLRMASNMARARSSKTGSELRISSLVSTAKKKRG